MIGVPFRARARASWEEIFEKWSFWNYTIHSV